MARDMEQELKAFMGKLKTLETRTEKITSEFIDLLDCLSDWLGYSCANMSGEPKDPDLEDLQNKTGSILSKMRKEYG